MDSQESVKIEVGLNYSKLPQDVQAASNHLKPLGQAAQHVNQQITDAARAANERARQYSEQYAHFWMKALDKQEAASRTAYERMYADLLKHRDKTEKAETAMANKRRKEVEAIHAQTRKNADDELKHREQIDKRMADNAIAQRNRAMRHAANSFIQNNQPSNGGSGGGGIAAVLAGGSGGSGGIGGLAALVGGAGGAGGGGVTGLLGGLAGGAASALTGIGAVIAALYLLVKVFDLVKAGAEGVANLVALGGQAWLKYSSHIQQVAIGFETLLGSQEKAQKHMLELAHLAESTPFEFDQLADASRRLLAMGVAASEVKTQIIAIGNAVSAVGGGAQQFERVVYAIGDIQAKGKLTGEEVRQLANNAIPVIRILTEELNISSKEARKLIENGKVSADTFTQAFQSFTERKFGEAMVKQSETLIGALSNMSDALHLKSYTAFKPLFDTISDIAVRFGAAMTGKGGIVDMLADTADEFGRTGGNLAAELIDGFERVISNPSSQERLLRSWMRLMQSLSPEGMARNAASGFMDTTLSRWIARMDGNKNPADAREAEALLERFRKSPIAPPKNAPLPTQIKPNESFEDYQERLAKMSVEKQFSDLTGGGDGEKVLNDYTEAMKRLTTQIEYFGQESNTARARQQLMTMGFKDFASAEAQAFIATAKRLDALEAQKKKQNELAQAAQTYSDKVKEVSRSVDASIIDLTMNAETGANNLAKFNAKTAKQIEDLGARAGKSAEQVSQDLEDVRVRLAQLDRDTELSSVSDAILDVDSNIAKLKYRLEDTAPEMELFYETVSRLGLEAKYGAEGFEVITEKLDEFLKKLRERLRLEDQLAEKRKREQDGLSDIESIKNAGKQLQEQLQENRYGGTRRTFLDKFLDDLTLLKEIKIPQGTLDSLKQTLTMDMASGKDYDPVEWLKILKDSLGEGDAKQVNEFFNALNRGLGAAYRATQEITPLQERRNQLDTEWRKLKEEVGIESEVAAKRYRNAWQEALNDVAMRDIEARESMIRSQVEIADQQVFHSEQARARVYEHMASAKGYTDIVSDAFISASDAIGDGMSSLFDKVNSGLGRFGEILTDIQTSLLKMVTNRLLMKLVDGLLGGGSSSGGGVSFGGGQGGGSFNPLSILTGGFGRVGTAPFNPNAGAGLFAQFAPNGIASVFGGQYGGSNLTTLDTFSGRAASGTGNPVFSAAARGGGMALNQSGLMASLAQAAPLLGLSFGASLGGNLGRGSRLGSIMGTVGGAALGGLGALLGTGYALSAATGVGAFSSFGALSALAPIAGAALPIAAIAAPLLIGAALLGRNSRRRKEETVRNDAMLEAFRQLDEIAQRIRSNPSQVASGLAQASIRESYIAEMSKLKDKKTRSHALADVSRIDARIATLRSVATGALNDNSRRNITSAFATGGVVSGQRGEPRVILAHGGEIVASIANQTPELVQAAAEAGIPNVRGGDGGGRGRHTSLNVELVIGTELQNKMFVNGAKSDEGYNVQMDNVRKGKSSRRRDI